MLIVCPHCSSQRPYQEVILQPRSTLTCKQCSKTFVAHLVTIRAKKSRGDKKTNTRQFSVRTIESNGAEEYIEFLNGSYEDFELRAKDKVVFIYINDVLKLVQNFTIHQYLTIYKPRSNCYIATHIYGSEANQTDFLRAFRDDRLVESVAGRLFINVYYICSPWLVSKMGRYRWFNQLAKKMIDMLISHLKR